MSDLDQRILWAVGTIMGSMTENKTSHNEDRLKPYQDDRINQDRFSVSAD